MLIDWFTVIAQAINFLILVWLLKRFLYQPILDAIDAREKRIANELADAAAKQAEAATEREAFRRKNAEFDRQRTDMLNRASDEAAAERRKLLDQARHDADELRDKMNDRLSGEYRHLHDEIARHTQAEVFAIARKTLADLSGASLEERMTDALIQHLANLGGDERQQLASLAGTDTLVLLRSAFELPPSQRDRIEAAVRATFGTGLTLQYETVPNLIGGIELFMQGRKIAWSISEYLATMERDLATLMKARSTVVAEEGGKNVENSGIRGE